MFTSIEDLRSHIENLIDFPIGLSMIRANQQFIDLIKSRKDFEQLSSKSLDFLAGRYCASEAIAQIKNGATQFPLPATSEGAPLWPLGLSGSITHKGELAMALTTEERFARGLGIDLERIDSSDIMLKNRVLSAKEIQHFSDYSLSSPLMSSLGFSIKEAYFKALSPQIKSRDLDFKDMEIELTQCNPGIIRFAVALLTNKFPSFSQHKAHGGALLSEDSILAIVHYK